MNSKPIFLLSTLVLALSCSISALASPTPLPPANVDFKIVIQDAKVINGQLALTAEVLPIVDTTSCDSAPDFSQFQNMILTTYTLNGMTLTHVEATPDYQCGIPRTDYFSGTDIASGNKVQLIAGKIGDIFISNIATID